MFGRGTYALNAAKIQRFRLVQVFLDTKFRFQTMFPLSPIKAALSLNPQIRVSSLLYMFSCTTLFYFSKQVCKTLVDFSGNQCYNTLIPKGIEITGGTYERHYILWSGSSPRTPETAGLPQVSYSIHCTPRCSKRLQSRRTKHSSTLRITSLIFRTP